jgi:hypothetical protein
MTDQYIKEDHRLNSQILLVNIQFDFESSLILKVVQIFSSEVCLGNAEKIHIWRAVLTYNQPRKSSCYVIRGYV